MITLTSGDILKSDCEVITIPVNTVCVMGAGLAKQAKLAYLGLEPMYKELCYKKTLQVGNPVIVRKEWNHAICLFPTKKDWRDPSQLIWIEDGLSRLVKLIVEERVGSIAIPALGAGLSGLAYKAVLPLLLQLAKKLGDYYCRIRLYQP